MPVTAWFLDVDGPVADPERKQVTEPRVLDELVLRLASGEPVVLNTGRSLAWVVDRVIAPLRHRCLLAGHDPDALMRDRLVVVGEKGGALASYDATGALVLAHDRRLALPLGLRAAVSRLVEERYRDSMFVDAGKETMISAEMADGMTVERYRAAQAAFAADVRELLHERALDGGVRVDETQIAVDIQHPRAGKHLGAERALRWLAERRVTIERCVCVGDSASDLEMADATRAAGFDTEFVFVGPEISPAALARPYPVLVTSGRNESGTLEMLAGDRERRGLRVPEGGLEV